MLASNLSAHKLAGFLLYVTYGLTPALCRVVSSGTPKLVAPLMVHIREALDVPLWGHKGLTTSSASDKPSSASLHQSPERRELEPVFGSPEQPVASHNEPCA